MLSAIDPLGLAELPLGIGLDWWLPADYSRHGVQIDRLFDWVFWITVGILLIVQLSLLVILIRYRSSQKTRAVYTHGNRRLEIIWTVIPTLILLGIMAGSEIAWHQFHDSTDINVPRRA